MVIPPRQVIAHCQQHARRHSKLAGCRGECVLQWSGSGRRSVGVHPGTGVRVNTMVDTSTRSHYANLPCAVALVVVSGFMAVLARW
jgi:hypothetical protein